MVYSIRDKNIVNDYGNGRKVGMVGIKEKGRKKANSF